MGKSRKWLYNAFENPHLSIDYILEIGKIIHYDFSEEIKELNLSLRYASDSKSINEEAEYWKTKYLELLEEYQAFLKAQQKFGEG